MDVPASVPAYLRTDAAESIKPGDARLQNSTVRLITTPQSALEAAAKVAQAAGYTPYILGDSLEGEARISPRHGRHGKAVALRGQPFAAPCVLLSGGETTVTLKGNGRGGRNVEFLLALAWRSTGCPGVHAIAGDTDGVDGIEEIAGACMAPDTIARARRARPPPARVSRQQRRHGFFQALGDSVITGPTRTNVNDFRAIVIDGQANGG
ncbi:MOFRL family protein [Ralstonia solanacearum]|uniref:MOFRL family protein n=1 Tax=Ralstonia solanacearum TaxID=305 RepID=UPI003AF32C8A